MKQLRIVTLRFGTGRQRMVLEPWTHPKPQRRTCSAQYEVPSCRGKSAGVAKRLGEGSPTRNPSVTIRNFPLAVLRQAWVCVAPRAQPRRHLHVARRRLQVAVELDGVRLLVVRLRVAVGRAAAHVDARRGLLLGAAPTPPPPPPLLLLLLLLGGARRAAAGVRRGGVRPPSPFPRLPHAHQLRAPPLLALLASHLKWGFKQGTYNSTGIFNTVLKIQQGFQYGP
jgi:hypothetical protein